MRRWRSLLASLTFLFASVTASGLHAQLGVASNYYYVVRSGGSIMIDAFVVMNPDCSVIGTASANLIEAPQGGQVSIGEELLYPNYPLGNPRFSCDKHRARHAAIRYRSNPGFVGTDRFSVELVFPGGIARTFRWTVSVRPSSGDTASFPSRAATEHQTASCSNENSLASLDSNTQTRITFANNARDPRSVYWINFNGSRVRYGVLGSHQRLSLNTFLTHPWVIADGGDNCLKVVLPEASGTYVSIR